MSLNDHLEERHVFFVCVDMREMRGGGGEEKRRGENEHRFFFFLFHLGQEFSFEGREGEED